MIRRMVLDVADMLSERGFTTPVIYGPERLDRLTQHASYIVFERDRDSGDTFGPPAASKRDPEYRGVRVVGVLCTVVARSPLDGARVEDHEELADALVDAVYCSLYRWVSEGKSRLDPPSGRFLRRDELGEIETFDGAVYSMSFGVSRGVYDREFDQSSPRERGLITGVAHTLTTSGSAPG